MRNADIQTDITKDESKGMVIKSWRPVFDGHKPDAPLELMCEMMGKTKSGEGLNPRQFRDYQRAYDIIYGNIEKEFNKPFKRL